MRISVGIPVYNQGKYLRKTLNSLLTQEVLPFEIVVSNNYSTDETKDVLSEFKGKVKIIKPPSHFKMTSHWNFLVKILKGEWFSLLSADDIAKPNFIKVLSEGIKRDKNSILVRSGYELIDGDDKILGERYILSVKKITKPPLTFNEQIKGPKINFAAFAVKKSIWEILKIN